VRVFERAPLLGPVGAGFLLQPTGLYVLDRLGMSEPILRHGARIHNLRCETVKGRRVLDLHYGEIHPDLCGIGLHRSALLEVLVRGLHEAQVPLELGRRMGQVSGGHLIDDAGRREGPFDLIIVADGARSSIRNAVPVRKIVREYSWGALWYMAPCS